MRISSPGLTEQEKQDLKTNTLKDVKVEEDLAVTQQQPTARTYPAGQVANLKDLLRQFFDPFEEGTINLFGFGLFEIGAQQTPTLSGNINPNDSTIQTKVLKDLTGNTQIASGFSNSFSVTGPTITDTRQFELAVEMTDRLGNTITKNDEEQITAVYPFFTGADANILTGSQIYANLTKRITTKSNKAITYNASNKRLYFAYPQSYGKLSSILDPNSFEVIGAFTDNNGDPFTATVQSSGLTSNYSEPYYVYRTAQTNANGGTFTFKF